MDNSRGLNSCNALQTFGRHFGFELLLLFEILEDFDRCHIFSYGVLGRVDGPNKFQSGTKCLVTKCHCSVDNVFPISTYDHKSEKLKEISIF